MSTTTGYQRPAVRVALMGLGRAMFNDHYSIFKAHPGLFDVVCACDILKERRDIIAKDFPNCKMFRQYSDMLEEPDIDLVDIATTSVDHVKHAIQSLKCGRWTLLESPMALTLEDAMILKGAAVKAKNRLIIFQRGLFDPDFLLAQQMLNDSRIGAVYDIKIRKEDWVRRDDWQCVKRLGGGACYYAMTDLLIMALKLLPSLPIQMWSDLKRIASVGDAEDFVHVNFKTRDQVSADIEFSGGSLPGTHSPSFEIRAERGTFSIQPGATEGVLTVIDPECKLPRRRSSVRTPDNVDMHEDVKVLKIPVSLPKGTPYGETVFWKRVYDAVRIAAPTPSTIEESMAAVKFAQLMKKTSPYGK